MKPYQKGLLSGLLLLETACTYDIHEKHIDLVALQEKGEFSGNRNAIKLDGEGNVIPYKETMKASKSAKEAPVSTQTQAEQGESTAITRYNSVSSSTPLKLEKRCVETFAHVTQVWPLYFIDVKRSAFMPESYCQPSNTTKGAVKDKGALKSSDFLMPSYEK